MKDNNIKSFSIDFNWYDRRVAPKNMFANADVGQWVEWCKELGCNNFWTFATSYNGHAWYPSQVAPRIDGLKSNFMKNCCDLGHANDMTVFAYMCLAANPYFERKFEGSSRGDERDMFRMIYDDRYLDYFVSICVEATKFAPIDGLVFDWFRGASVTRREWSPLEKDLYSKRLGEKFPSATPSQEMVDIYDRTTIEYAWKMIRQALSKELSKGFKIWTNHPFEKPNDPIWQNHVLLKEVDYVLNESPNLELLKWIDSQVGEDTAVVQNYCGWDSHDSSKLGNLDISKYGKFGFAQADPDTCLPTERMSATNYKNIEIMKKMFANK